MAIRNLRCSPKTIIFALVGALSASCVISIAALYSDDHKDTRDSRAATAADHHRVSLNETEALVAYNAALSQNSGIEYPELVERLGPPRNYVNELPFDSTKARYFEMVSARLRMSEAEIEAYKKNGFVAIDQDRRLNFPAAYRQIFTSDLPLFITSDSILHALHKSYGAMLKELEEVYLREELARILADCHNALLEQAQVNEQVILVNSFRDVDLYLSVARSLLSSHPAEGNVAPSKGSQPVPRTDFSKLGQEREVDKIIGYIDSLVIQMPSGDKTEIYGGLRAIDYSQFKPRGHYGGNTKLESYFRCMMWLSRADCGWYVIPGKSTPFNVSMLIGNCETQRY